MARDILIVFLLLGLLASAAAISPTPGTIRGTPGPASFPTR